MIAPRKPNEPKFPLGRVVATPEALDKLAESSENAAKFLRQHQLGCWGEICSDDAEANEQALEDGDRILSVYHTAKGRKIYVITEADRSSTCILLPEEY